MIDFSIHTQPDDETCGPTSLQAIYRYYGLDLDLKDVIQGVERSLSGGTLSPMLGKHALLQGFRVSIYINNLTIFDPTWFDVNNGHGSLDVLRKKLIAQMKYKRNKTMLHVSQAYLEYLALGGELRFKTLSVQLLKSYFSQKIPILTALSATYLYRSSRELFVNGESIYHDVRGFPCGHFVVLCGYDDNERLIVVADPHRENPISKDNYYRVNSHQLINAIMVSDVTHDASLIIIQPKSDKWKH